MLNLGEPDEIKVNQLKEQLNEKLDVYEIILSKQPYLAGQVTKKFFIKFYMISLFLDIYSS